MNIMYMCVLFSYMLSLVIIFILSLTVKVAKMYIEDTIYLNLQIMLIPVAHMN